MKKKYIIIPVSALALIMAAYFPIKKTIGKTDFMSGWGKVLSEDSKNKTEGTQQGNTGYKVSVKGTASKNIVSNEDIFEAGNDVIITKQEIETAKAFYVLQGQSDREAEQAAVKYVEEYNALYVDAVNNGFDVTEQEVDEYITNLKTMAKQAENSEDVKKVISQFNSEDEYWDYQKIVCQKQLPIQKYVQSLEKTYSDDINSDVDSETFTSMWNDELNKMKEESAKRQQYKKMDSTDEPDEKFEVKTNN